MYDIVITGASILDGTGAASFSADVAITGSKIVKIAPGISGGKKTIDATGLTLTPGFIDSHSHCDLSILSNQDQKELAEQGITFFIAGNCGSSFAPAPQPGRCKTMEGFVSQVQAMPLGASFGMLVGHGTLRLHVVGSVNRPVTDRELEKMAQLLEDSLQHGAIGMSLGLTYPPGSYADIRELTALAKVVARHGGIVSAHIRNESDKLLESVEEFITVIRDAGCKGVISHLKAADKANWGKVRQALAMADAAVAEGVAIYADAYPYCASKTSLLARFVPRQFHPEGTTRVVSLLDDPEICQAIKAWATEKWGTDLSWVLVTNYSAQPEYVGKTINEIAQNMGLSDRYEAVFTLLRQNNGRGQACYTMMCEEDVRYVLAHPRVMIGTDSDMGGKSAQYHPRLRGAFPRALGKYVREENITSLPEMIRKMTSLPAQVYNLPGKGRIAEGYDADICILDAQTIQDQADYVNCSAPNKGLRYVLINGQVVVENNTYNGTRAGRFFGK